ncbi:TPA: hypothetical protein EYP70_07885 [Candidatus Bathyarchaeota archaeon]|nr:hypothetical protein [Candidatus Bathyarchaeota archaeon]
MLKSRTKRTVIIGLDGVPYGLVSELTSRDVMPNLKQLMDEGFFRRMKSSLPEISAVSWSSLITGKNPGEHGVFGFTDLLEGFYVISFHSSKKLKAPPFWKIDNSKRYVIINLPATYPATNINGILISGFVSPDLKGAVYPKTYLKMLEKEGYKIDIDIERAKLSGDILIRQLQETLNTRIRVTVYLMNNIKWDVLMLVITGTDRLEHFLWNAYEDPRHKHHQDFLDYFSAVDKEIGRVLSAISDDDLIVILSDHGMEKLEINVNINTILSNEGFLVIENNPKKGYNSIKRETKAFALEPSRIYLNMKGRYPRGSLSQRDAKEVLEELEDLFYSIKWKGRRVIKKVYRREEIYRGKYLDKAPDIVLLSEKGFNLRAKLFRKKVFEKEDLTGKHTWDDAFLFMKSSDAYNVPNDLTVENVLPLIKSFER